VGHTTPLVGPHSRNVEILTRASADLARYDKRCRTALNRPGALHGKNDSRTDQGPAKTHDLPCCGTVLTMKVKGLFEDVTTNLKTSIDRRLPRLIILAVMALSIWVLAEVIPTSFIENQAHTFYNSGHPAIAENVFSWECSSQHADACLWLRLEHETLLQTQAPDLQRAAAVNVKACDGDKSEGCLNLGKMFKYGLGVPLDYSRALALFSKACDEGFADGCADLGVMYLDGMGVTQNRFQATALLSKACEAGSAKGCNGLGCIYAEGEDYSRAKVLFFNSCNAGDASGCAHLGRIYEDGLSVPQNYYWAVRLYSKACDSEDAEGCNLLGVAYDEGHGAKQDFSRARELFDKACHGGSEDGCSNYKDKLDQEHADDHDASIG